MHEHALSNCSRLLFRYVQCVFSEWRMFTCEGKAVEYDRRALQSLEFTTNQTGTAYF